MKIYYAHFMGLYNTPQEKRDMNLLGSMGFEVINPNTPETQEEFDKWKQETPFVDEMMYFHWMINKCDALAYRALINLKISSGVYSEIEYAKKLHIPIIELPTITKDRILDLEETRNYLKLTGQR